MGWGKVVCMGMHHDRKTFQGNMVPLLIMAQTIFSQLRRTVKTRSTGSGKHVITVLVAASGGLTSPPLLPASGLLGRSENSKLLCYRLKTGWPKSKVI